MQVELDNAFDVLRIIAKDAVLSNADRASINSAADDLEHRERQLVALYSQHLELQQRLIAVTDQLIEARKELAAKPTQAMWSCSSGWMQAS